jgi:hypothetical protein
MFDAQGEKMPTLDEVYRQFGEAAEAAQMLETELGNLAIDVGITENEPALLNNPKNAHELLERINRKTFGQLLGGLKGKAEALQHLELILTKALQARNRLSHSFYREHNYRRNSEEGRSIMLEDLRGVHQTIFSAYKALLEASGVDFGEPYTSPPTNHLKLHLGGNEISPDA